MASTDLPTIGFIGLGQMGAPMVRNLIQALQRTGWGKAGWRARRLRSAWTPQSQGITIAGG